MLDNQCAKVSCIHWPQKGCLVRTPSGKLLASSLEALLCIDPSLSSICSYERSSWNPRKISTDEVRTCMYAGWIRIYICGWKLFHKICLWGKDKVHKRHDCATPISVWVNWVCGQSMFASRWFWTQEPHIIRSSPWQQCFCRCSGTKLTWATCYAKMLKWEVLSLVWSCSFGTRRSIVLSAADLSRVVRLFGSKNVQNAGWICSHFSPPHKICVFDWL